MKTIIIDDEPKARRLLKVLLEENCPQVSEIYTAESLLGGVEIIKAERPKIVFLDIEMPEHSGLQILDFIDRDIIDFEIVFTTAYDSHAIQAFELTAIDYLLKPLRATQVIKAVDKCISQMDKQHLSIKLKELKEGLSLNEFKKIGLPVVDGIKFVELNHIILFEGNGMYTKVVTVNETEILISKPIKYFADLLKKVPYFYKPHRSFLVNLRFLKQYVKSKGGYLVMDNGQTVSISKEKREEFLQIANNI